MNREKFSEAIATIVRSGALETTEAQLRAPLKGAQVSHKRLATWFKGLSEADKKHVLAVAEMAIDYNMFRFLCVLDGVAFIEDSKDKGAFELYFVKGKERVQLNGPDGEELHSLYQNNLPNS